MRPGAPHSEEQIGLPAIARNPVALDRLTYERTAKAVTYRSNKLDVPTEGIETVEPSKILILVLVHIPD